MPRLSFRRLLALLRRRLRREPHEHFAVVEDGSIRTRPQGDQCPIAYAAGPEFDNLVESNGAVERLGLRGSVVSKIMEAADGFSTTDTTPAVRQYRRALLRACGVGEERGAG